MTRVERLGPADWNEFRDIRLRALADAPSAFSVLLVDVQDAPEEHWRSRLSTGSPVLVVRSGGRPVAMGGGFVPEETGPMSVWGMWTAPEARGEGHARAILTTLLDHAQERGITTVELHVTEGNETARRFYEDLGFETTGEWEPLRTGSALRVELLRRVR